MSAEDQIEVVQCQGGRPALPTDVGKNALRELAQNEIFFHNRHPVGLHRINGEIGGDVVQALARNLKKDIVECASKPASGSRVKVDYGGPERWNVGRWDKLIVDPELIVALGKM